MKIHTQYPGNILVNMCRVVAKATGKQLEVQLVDDATRATKEYKAINPTNKFPLLETPEGNLQESMTIAKYLADGHATLLGKNAVERAQVDQWTTWLINGTYQKGYAAFMGIFGQVPVEQAVFNDAVTNIKAMVRTIDQNLTGDWIVGSKVTVADYALAAITSVPFQVVLDAGFKKAAPKACAWFARVAALPEFVAIFGRVKQCAKALKPVIKAKEEPKKKAQPAAAKKPADDMPAMPKSDKNPLDCLPPSPWNFYDFKTLFVNHPDKRGGGMQALKEQFDPAGYSFWYVHYEKFGEEGKVFFKFDNLLQGFLQRFDHFRKHAFGKVNMLGEEPNLEIKGVFCFRGLELPQEAKDHPQFEYMQPRKMDINNEADFKLIAEHWGAKAEENTCEGMAVVVSSWHK